MIIYARPGESTDSLIRRFQKKCFYENLIDEINGIKYYLKPSQERNIKNQKMKRWDKKKEKSRLIRKIV